MFNASFNELGRASKDAIVLAALGVHPVYLRGLLQRGFLLGFRTDPRVPTFPNAKQSLTLGKGVFLTTQWGKADQYVVPLGPDWIKEGEFDFVWYDEIHAKDTAVKYSESSLRKAVRYMLIIKADMEGAFCLTAGVIDLQACNVPMLDWVRYLRTFQEDEDAS